MPTLQPTMRDALLAAYRTPTHTLRRADLRYADLRDADVGGALWTPPAIGGEG